MLITKEADYAIRIMRALRNERLMTVEDICRQELVPKQFAYKILKKLEKAGLVRIKRGARGGCLLGCAADTITLYDIIVSVDEEISVSQCLRDGVTCEYRSRARTCSIHEELARIQKLMEEELKRHSLKQLMEPIQGAWE